MKVAYFAASMVKDQDGVARVIYHWIDYFKKNRIKSIFITSLNSKIKENELNIHQVPSFKFNKGKNYKVPIALPSQAFFYRKIKKFKPDIIHINSPCSLGLAAINYAKLHKIPIVATYHTNFTSYLRYYNLENFEPIVWLYLKKLYNKCDQVYIPSESIREELEYHGLKKLKLLPHGIDDKTFNIKFKSLNWKESLDLKDKIIILYVGRLVWEKDLKDLAKVYSLLKNDKRLAFVLVGDGSAKSELEKLMPNAKFLGKLTGKALSTAYASSDIFVFPSTTETFGNVTIEAMISGLACVCADAGGTKGIIKNNITGLLVKPHNIKDFANKISYLVSNKNKRLQIAKKGYEYAKTQTWDKICKELFKNYEEVIRNYEKNTKKLKRKFILSSQ